MSCCEAKHTPGTVAVHRRGGFRHPLLQKQDPAAFTSGGLGCVFWLFPTIVNVFTVTAWSCHNQLVFARCRRWTNRATMV